MGLRISEKLAKELYKMFNPGKGRYGIFLSYEDILKMEKVPSDGFDVYSYIKGSVLFTAMVTHPESGEKIHVIKRVSLL